MLCITLLDAGFAGIRLDSTYFDRSGRALNQPNDRKLNKGDMKVTPFQGVNSPVYSWFVRLGHIHCIVVLVFVCLCDFMIYLMWVWFYVVI